MQTTLQTELALINLRATLERLQGSLDWLASPPAQDAAIPLESRLQASMTVLGSQASTLQRHLATLEQELAS
jgi:hypothetical protein